MIKRFQREGIDPLGLGDQAKSQNRRWNEQQWKDNYPHAEVHVNIDTQIKETGIKE
jgi:spore germination protein